MLEEVYKQLVLVISFLSRFTSTGWPQTCFFSKQKITYVCYLVKCAYYFLLCRKTFKKENKNNRLYSIRIKVVVNFWLYAWLTFCVAETKFVYIEFFTLSDYLPKDLGIDIRIFTDFLYPPSPSRLPCCQLWVLSFILV